MEDKFKNLEESFLSDTKKHKEKEDISQTDIFKAAVRQSNRLKFHVVNKVSIPFGKSKEYVTKNGEVICVEHLRDEVTISLGLDFESFVHNTRSSKKQTGFKSYYRINFNGNVLSPYSHKGVINFINNN